MSKNYLAKVVITILDNKWSVYFKNTKQYEASAPEGSRAFCNVRLRTISFNCEATYPGDGVVAHELMHAYISDLQGRDLNLSSDQFDCTIMEYRASQLLDKAKPLSRKLQAFSKKLKAKAAITEEDDDD